MSSEDEGAEEGETVCWTLAETAINENARRTAGLEGHVGRRGEGSGPATLWEGVQTAEARLDGVEEWVGVTLTDEVRHARAETCRAYSVAESASRTCDQYLGTGAQAAFMLPMTRRMDAQDERLRDQRREIADLLATMRQQQAIISGIFDGSIALPRGPASRPGRPCAWSWAA